ncbi:CDP-glucose 4,6-dehydratase [Paenibacillus sp. SI8]|uniref:CDP-glucose 4,6-dehydratase n=1 Tax=unclassified Paenibacillus TaxID=185978 RepID=UPI003466ADE2
MVAVSFWLGKRVLITGHTGFKGSWLSLWLQRLGASVTGYALLPAEGRSLFMQASVEDGITSIEGDVRDLFRLNDAVKRCQPDIIFHLAAQPLVRVSYQAPVETFAVNVIGTANVLESARSNDTVKVVINVTSDKCYENRERLWPYREEDRLGGYDPYSASKACAEIVSDAYRKSFFSDSLIALSTVRSGNVIGGGDWAQDRLVPDLIKGLLDGKPRAVRDPEAVRPWQHVLDPLHGYLLLAEKMYAEGGRLAEAWNFGPDTVRPMSVGEVASELLTCWGDRFSLLQEAQPAKSSNRKEPHEAHYLALDCSKAKSRLGWKPHLDTKEAIQWTVDWYQTYAGGADVREMTLRQIEAYERLEV